MRALFGPHTPQPFAMASPDGPMYLFCVAMPPARIEETLERGGGWICCQPEEGQVFCVSQYTEHHMIRPAGRQHASGEEVYELVPVPAAAETRKDGLWRRIKDHARRASTPAEYPTSL